MDQLKYMACPVIFCIVVLRLMECFLLVDKPTEVNFTTVRESLMHIVPLCLDSDPSLIPLSCKNFLTNGSNPLLTSNSQRDSAMVELESDQEHRDPDDFSFWSERQAKRICAAVKQIFGVDYAPEVVVADANLTALANRILVSKEILSPGV